MFSKKPNRHQFLGNYYKKFVDLELELIAQSSHTVSAQLLNKLGYCPSGTVSVLLAFHKRNSLPVGQMRAFMCF